MSVCGVKKKEETKKLIIHTLIYTHPAHSDASSSFPELSFDRLAGS